nr:MAG TPA: hypothetical protein [Caudoviricetes sp.]
MPLIFLLPHTPPPIISSMMSELSRCCGKVASFFSKG